MIWGAVDMPKRIWGIRGSSPALKNLSLSAEVMTCVAGCSQCGHAEARQRQVELESLESPRRSDTLDIDYSKFREVVSASSTKIFQLCANAPHMMSAVSRALSMRDSCESTV